MISIIRKTHGLLVGWSVTRKWQRNLVVAIKETMGISDAYAELTELIRRVRPDVYLDIGSHDGNTIARILEDCDISVYGFEPTPSTYERLKSRFEQEKRVTVVNKALSNCNGTSRLFCNVNEQTNSLLDNDIGNLSALGNQASHLKELIIESVRLDDWVAAEQPAGLFIVKSDIQGAEGLLLEGGEETFRNRVVAFYSECQIAPMYKNQSDFFDLHRHLTTRLGYKLANIYPCMLDSTGVAMQTDALWINPRLMKDIQTNAK